MSASALLFPPAFERPVDRASIGSGCLGDLGRRHAELERFGEFSLVGLVGVRECLGGGGNPVAGSPFLGGQFPSAALGVGHVVAGP
jgi:hypothetical protein